MNETKKMANIEEINEVSSRENKSRTMDLCLKNHYYYLLYVTEKTSVKNRSEQIIFI